MATKRPRTETPPGYRSAPSTNNSDDDDDDAPEDLNATPKARPPFSPNQSYFDSSSSAPPPAKSHRGNPPPSRQLLCTLPPTCNVRPTQLSSTQELESHYSKFHAFVCEINGCGCVFPESRLLDLHFTECHDPLATLRKERGEKIFGCHLVTCERLFSTPKTRRLHLISAHGYPSQYFFAITNKGVGGLLKKWGEGASMVRGPWKARGTDIPDMAVDEDDDDSEEDKEDSDDSSMDDASSDIHEQRNGEVQGLHEAMGSLTLVPPAIRFGRGGKTVGLGGASARHIANEDARENVEKSKARAKGKDPHAEARKGEKKLQVKNKGRGPKEKNVGDGSDRVDGAALAISGSASERDIIDEDMLDELEEAQRSQEETMSDQDQHEVNGSPSRKGRGRGRARGRSFVRGAAPTLMRGGAPIQSIQKGPVGRGGVRGRGVGGPRGFTPGMVPVSVLLRARGIRGRGRGFRGGRGL